MTLVIREPWFVRVWRKIFETDRQARRRRIIERREYNMRRREYALKPQQLPGGEPWRAFIGDFPFQHTIVEAYRPEWGKSEVVVPAEMPPWMNVAGLYWRPIATEPQSLD